MLLIVLDKICHYSHAYLQVIITLNYNIMKLASIEKIKNVRKHPNADRLKIANVNEYQVVTAADLQDGNLVVYFALDSILPEIPLFEFMRNNKFRVSMVRLRGEVSNGLIIPYTEIVKEFPDLNYYDVGQDVSKIIGVKKYSKPVPAQLSGEVLGQFPTDLLSKTDEDRLENFPLLFEQLMGEEVYITLKIDGSSATFIKKDSKLRICTRNLELKYNEDNALWKIAKKYDLENMLPDDVALQGEIYGEGVQKNPLGIKGQDVMIFNAIDLSTRKPYGLEEMKELCEKIKIPMVPVIFSGAMEFEYVGAIKKFADFQKYSNGKPAEGIVVRPKRPFFSPELGKYASLKVISENYKD